MAVNVTGDENRLVTPSLIAMESLYRLKDHLVMPKVANRTYEDYYEDKIGDTLTVKRPYRAKVTKGNILDEADMIDKTVSIVVNGRYNAGLKYSDTDMTLNIVDFGRRYLDAHAEELAYKFDIEGANELSSALFAMEGTAGTALNLASAQFIRAHATKLAMPKNNRNIALLDPLDIAEISEDIHEVDNPELVGQNIRDSYRGKLAGYNVMESVHIPYLEVAAVPTAAAPLINGTNQRGDEIATDGWTNAGAVVLKKGQLIQIANVMEVQPRGDRRKTGNTMTFVVREDVTPAADGSATIKIYPDINAGTDEDTVPNPSGSTLGDPEEARATLDASAFQTVNAVPADNAAITVIGRITAAGTPSAGLAADYRQGLWFVGDALEYVNVELHDFESAVASGVEVDEETGVSIAYLCDFTIKNRTERKRLDILFGVKTVYPEIGIRHIGKKVG